MDAKTLAEIQRKVDAGLPLVGDQKGNITAENLAVYQQLMSAKANTSATNASSQQTGQNASGSANPGGTTYYPGNDIIPSTTNTVATGYGYTIVVGVGVAFMLVSMLSGFRRARGR